jgi:ABC-type bacteriocin/lantibiotic exporter with double-glycine peptidase domain
MITVINRKPLIDGFSETGDFPNEKPQGQIELKDVNFSYPSRPDSFICNGYNLTIQPGETVALVGASGCGKVVLF